MKRASELWGSSEAWMLTVLHGLTNITPGADGMRLVVGKIICEHQTQTNAACE